MPVLHPPEDGEVAELQRNYDYIWNNGFIPFLRASDGVIRKETEQYLLLSVIKLHLGLVREKANNTGNRPKLEDAYDKLHYMAWKGFCARLVGGGQDAIVLFKPGEKENLDRNLCFTSEGDLTNKIPIW